MKNTIEGPVSFRSGRIYDFDIHEELIPNRPVARLQPSYGSYDRYVVFLSGGKDSVAALLHLLDLGVSAAKIECHHHLIDGDIEQGDDNRLLMDWPCTVSYCEELCKALGVAFYKSWKHQGFWGELMRDNSPTGAVSFESPNGVVTVGGNSASLGTRKRFPERSGDLGKRWCSSYLKVDVGKKVLVHQARFRRGRTLVVTGERAEESINRSRYAFFEPHSSSATKMKVVDGQGKPVFDDTGAPVYRYRRVRERYIDHVRLVHDWPESRVWEIIKKHQVQPHPAYELGWGRTSCMTCIFGSPNQWATIKAHMPSRFRQFAEVEQDTGHTLFHRKLKNGSVETIPITVVAEKGTPYVVNQYWLDAAMSPYFSLPIFNNNWQLPPGAYGESCGPV